MKKLSCWGCELNGLWGLSCKAEIRVKLKAQLEELGIVLENKKSGSDNLHWGAEEIRVKFEIEKIVKEGGKCKELVD